MSNGTGLDELVILENLQISEEAAEEVANQLDEPLGLIRDLTYTGDYLIVRWPEEDGEDDE